MTSVRLLYYSLASAFRLANVSQTSTERIPTVKTQTPHRLVIQLSLFDSAPRPVTRPVGGRDPQSLTPWRSRPTPAAATSGPWVWRHGLRVRNAGAATPQLTTAAAGSQASSSRIVVERPRVPAPAQPLGNERQGVFGVTLVTTCFMVAALLF